MSKRIAFVAATLVVVAGLAVPAAGASRHMLIGFNDEANTLYGNADATFPIMQQLHTQVLRVNLYWGGTPFAVANSEPTDAADPGDAAYNWSAYDRLVRYASQYKIKIVFSILFAPKWANGGKARYTAPSTTAGWNALRDFAYAAATRYSGTYTAPVEQQDPNNSTSALPLPAVRFWTAWNEPNNPVFLRPQWTRVGGKAVNIAARNYVKICNAVYGGVHKTSLSGEKVACGVTAPRGNNVVNSSRSSTDPYSFMRALKADGLRKFDVYAHHPYYQFRNESPTTPPRARTAATMGVLPKFMAQLQKLYPGKHLWITEYGYQTPPEKFFAVSLANQAKYLTQAFAIARKNPKIDMMLWFLVKDDPSLAGWQSGVMSASGKKKPSFTAFFKLPH